MGVTPTTEAVIGKFTNGRNDQSDFLQLISNSGGNVFAWIDSTGTLRGSFLSTLIGGTTNEVQVNQSGSFYADSGFTYTPGTPGVVQVPVLQVGATDTGLSRASAGHVAVGNGTNGDASGTIAARNVLVRNLEQVLYVDAANSQGWPGADVGAWINAAYAALQSPFPGDADAAGGRIKVAVNPAGAYVFTTPIVFNTLGKPVLLEGDPGTCLQWNSTSGTAITFNCAGASGGPIHGRNFGMKNIGLIGSTSGLGFHGSLAGMTAIGLTVGGTLGTDPGAEGFQGFGLNIGGFGTALNFGTNCFGVNFESCSFQCSAKILNAQQLAGTGEMMSFNACYFGNNIDLTSVFGGGGGFGKGVDIEVEITDWLFSGCSFDNVQLYVGGVESTVRLNGCHFENPPGASSYGFNVPYIQNASGTIIANGLWMSQDDTPFIISPACYILNQNGSVDITGYHVISSAPLTYLVQDANTALTRIVGNTTFTNGFTNAINHLGTGVNFIDTVAGSFFTGTGAAVRATNPTFNSGTLTMTSAFSIDAHGGYTFNGAESADIAAPSLYNLTGVGLRLRSGAEIDVIYGSGNVFAGQTTPGTDLWFFDDSGNLSLNGNISLASGKDIKWNSDTGISRASAGVIDIGNGTAGDASGTVNAAQYNVAGDQIEAADLSNGVTGTGAVVLANAPTFTANPTFASSTGTGAVVLATSPSFAAGTVTIGASSTLTMTSGFSINGNGTYTILGSESGDPTAPCIYNESGVGIRIRSGAQINAVYGSGTRFSGQITPGTDIWTFDGSGNLNVTGIYENGGTSGVSAGSFSTITAITTKGGIVTQLTGSSDDRLKIAQPYEAGLEAVLGISPIKYRWNQAANAHAGLPTDQDFIGFSAQNVQKSIPEAITNTEGEEKYLALDTRPIIAALVNAVKELSAKVTLLESKLATL